MAKFIFGGFSDVGFSREINEDYMNGVALPDGAVLVVIADGLGSKAGGIQPAAIACNEILNYVLNVANSEDSALSGMYHKNPGTVLRQSFMLANRVLLAYKAANEELFGGFGTCVTAAIIRADESLFVCHCGNCRLYIIRGTEDDENPATIVQITKDMTEAQELINQNKLDPAQYYFDDGRYRLTSGLGIETQPNISSLKGRVKVNDLVLLSTDGVHYSIRPEPIMQIILQSEDCATAGKNLAEAAKQQQQPDNATAMIVQVRPD